MEGRKGKKKAGGGEREREREGKRCLPPSGLFSESLPKLWLDQPGARNLALNRNLLLAMFEPSLLPPKVCPGKKLKPGTHTQALPYGIWVSQM